MGGKKQPPMTNKQKKMNWGGRRGKTEYAGALQRKLRWGGRWEKERKDYEISIFSPLRQRRERIKGNKNLIILSLKRRKEGEREIGGLV